ncbi:hypothetical protein CO701_20240 [Citrobacter werkmanii]|nr:hypothetical protein CO701_20240 [Citrobacter werkmanii]
MWFFVKKRVEQCHDSIRVVAVMENNKRIAIADNGVIWMRPPYGKDKITRTPFLQPDITVFIYLCCSR